jgi:hypothetical protein
VSSSSSSGTAAAASAPSDDEPPVDEWDHQDPYASLSTGSELEGAQEL